MRWREGRKSENVEDRRGMRVSRGFVGGGVGTIIIVLVAWYFGIDPTVILNQREQTNSTPVTPSLNGQLSKQDNELADFVSVVLADTEDAWHEIFSKMGRTYQEPTLVLFTDAAESACGFAQSAVGPFYCPADHKVYIDLSFYHDLKERFQAPGDFAQAYVIAHEVGHHVQTLLGISQKVRSAQDRLGETEMNRLSVLQELQADCFAGVWAYHADKARKIVEEGDIEEGLNAAASIGDDRIQMQSRGYVSPESFTHGSSRQRVQWFRRGIKSGDLEDCDTFSSN
jgi:predicted metalloprotease